MSQEKFVQMELGGSNDEIDGFIEEMRLATATEDVWYCHDGDVQHESLLDSIREKIGLETHVVMNSRLADTVADYLERSKVLESSVTWVKEISQVELGFKYRCYSAEVGAQVRKVIEDHLPDGVELEDYVVTEEVDDESEGVELYSPSPTPKLRT